MVRANRRGARRFQKRGCLVVKAGPDEIKGDVEAHLPVASNLFARQIARPPIEPVEGECLAQNVVGFGASFQFAEDDGFEIAGAKVVRVEAQGTVEMKKRLIPI